MSSESAVPAGWTPEQAAQSKCWVKTWARAGEELERLRREELRALDTFNTISLLCGPADYTKPPFAPKPYSGLAEQQKWFMKLLPRE